VSPKLKRLSGPEVVSLFRGLGFSVAKQNGSHVKLVRVTSTGERQILTVPNHTELDVGTLHAIVRQASRFVSEHDLREHFYSL
jgi:predicted RNA binding protein YcfA (HicA-like mRNA interferase family)